MALAGAGNPVGGSNPSGISKGLNYVGNHAYAYSGQIQTSDSPKTHLEFFTGPSYLIGTLDCLGAVKADDIGSGTIAVFLLTLNDEEISTIKVDSEVEDQPSNSTIRIFIPPYTKVKITVDSLSSTAGFKTSCNITGRVYA
jgi:hypothetical protein